jgi:hypothetical protein
MWNAIKKILKFVVIVYVFIFMMMLGLILMTNMMLTGLS